MVGKSWGLIGGDGGGGGAGTNIYNSDGTLTADRTLIQAGFDLLLHDEVSETIDYGLIQSTDVFGAGVTAGSYSFYRNTSSNLLALAGSGDRTMAGQNPATSELLSSNTSTGDQSTWFTEYQPAGVPGFYCFGSAINGTAISEISLTPGFTQIRHTPDDVTQTRIVLAANRIYTDTRFELSVGADVVAANDIVLGRAGNSFTVTGNTQINTIATHVATVEQWQEGSEITLILTGTPTLKHNTGAGVDKLPLLLLNGVDFTVSKNPTIIHFRCGATHWQQTAPACPLAA